MSEFTGERRSRDWPKWVDSREKRSASRVRIQINWGWGAYGDFTNVNKRRKEEAAKMNQLRRTYGDNVRYILFLCGYFDSGYLGYEAAEGIDWVWEHRIDDLAEFGL